MNRPGFTGGNKLRVGQLSDGAPLTIAIPLLATDAAIPVSAGEDAKAFKRDLLGLLACHNGRRGSKLYFLRSVLAPLSKQKRCFVKRCVWKADK